MPSPFFWFFSDLRESGVGAPAHLLPWWYQASRQQETRQWPKTILWPSWEAGQVTR